MVITVITHHRVYVTKVSYVECLHLAPGSFIGTCHKTAEGAATCEQHPTCLNLTCHSPWVSPFSLTAQNLFLRWGSTREASCLLESVPEPQVPTVSLLSILTAFTQFIHSFSQTFLPSHLTTQPTQPSISQAPACWPPSSSLKKPPFSH